MDIEKNNSPPYLLRLLCLLPLIGFFVGLALIIYGVFKYRDKRLVIIGLTGLIITTSVYSFLFYNLKYGKNATESFKSLSQSGLNNLVGRIEVYKLKEGVYPDSLEQIAKIDSMAFIQDPILLRKMDKDIKTTFIYRKTGNKYLLFSSGPDGIPYTADDIFPSILKLDTLNN